jgi:hypothetical protein
VRAEPGAGAQIDQRDRAIVGGGDHAERRQHVNAAADLVHLVAVRPAQWCDAVPPRGRECRQLRAERGIRRRLLASRYGVVPRDRRIRLGPDEVLEDRGQQQRREAVGWDLGGQVQQDAVPRDRRERR